MVYVIPLDRMLRQCRWPACHVEPIEREIPLCERHFQYIGERFMQERSILGGSFVREARPSPEEREAEWQAREDERARLLEEQSVVYYVRIGDRVKIGFSANLRQRLIALRLDDSAILATEPGGRMLETQRHREFAEERVGRREDFNPSRRLLAHIKSVREQHGRPTITTYPKVS